MFPKNLPKEIEFVINLILKIEPISIPPYRVALAKLKELKEQANG